MSRSRMLHRLMTWLLLSTCLLGSFPALPSRSTMAAGSLRGAAGSRHVAGRALGRALDAVNGPTATTMVEVSPGQLEERLEAGEMVTRTLLISNTGGSDLRFSLDISDRPGVGAGQTSIYPNEVASPTFVSVQPGQGVVGPGDARQVTVRLDATALDPDTYAAVIGVRTNDPAQPLTSIPLTLTVVANLPIAGLAASSSSPTTLGDTTAFTATVAEGTDVAYQWDFGDGHTATGAHATHVYSATGTYTATVTAVNTRGSTSAATVVRVLDVPPDGLVASSSSPSELGSATSFTATLRSGTGITYTWNFGDGGKATGATATHTYPATGKYTAMVTASNSRGQLSARTVVVVRDVPIAGLAISGDPVELGGVTVFTATHASGTNVTYAWDFGDGTTAIGRQVEHSYTRPGSYTVRLTATNSRGSATATTEVIIREEQRGARVWLPLVSVPTSSKRASSSHGANAP